jgi:LuxR family transcriptional regulator, maltose regulon positive regulatory protein
LALEFLATKTSIPLVSSHLVTRPHLVETLNQCLQPGIQVVLVSAPAGFGKTTLLAQWLRGVSDDFRVSWLTLDEEDNQLTRFFSYMVASIQNSLPEIARDFLALTESTPNFTADQGIAYLINQLSDSEQNLILIIDDYHVITTPEIHLAIKSLLEHLPDNFRLVIAGRVEPPLQLARLRARGKLVEVHTADLRFSVNETNRFFAHFPGLSALHEHETLISRLNDSTEGWAAGLQMTAIALKSELSHTSENPIATIERFAAELSGSHRYIFDYLMDEVLSHEPSQIREFLLRTCLLERFNAELCAAVIASEHTISMPSREALEYLERTNLFIIPLDNQREWYRYHHLFADVLQKQLLHSYPGLAPVLHRRAAKWLERQGMLDEALSHALQSDDINLPVTFVEKHSLTAILEGRIATAQRWMDSLPGHTLLSSPRLCLNRAWALTFTTQTEAALPYLERAEALLAGDTDIKEEGILAVKSEVFGLQCYRETMYGNADEALRLARLALENTPADNSFLLCCNRLFYAGALSHAGRLEEALQEYRTIQPLCQIHENMAGLALIHTDFLEDTAIYLQSRGAARDGKELLQHAIQNLEKSASGSRQPAALSLYVGLGKILFLENQLDEAERVLEMGLQLEPVSMNIGVIDGWLVLWRVKNSQADYPAGRHILGHLEQTIRESDEKVIRMLMLCGVNQDLLEGHIEQAATHIEQLGLTGDVDKILEKVKDSELMGWRSHEFITYARLLTAQGKADASLLILERIASAAQSFHMDWLLYHSWIMQAIVHYQAGCIDRAIDIMNRLFEKTSRLASNPARIYLDSGEAARSLLQEIIRRGIHREYSSTLLSLFPPQRMSVSTPEMPETLTERELEVLHLMADGLKNQEIADRLVISLNTIRYHLKNVFGKLGVSTRTAAIARSHQLGILTSLSE